ncbi:exonuclease domain-containing protein [Xanthobacteraceae bacterium A53D]
MPNQRVIVLDTETTGVLPYDKMVSIAAIRFDRGVYAGHIYRVYDPRKDSHPEAVRIHGWDDWRLRFQPLFAEEADEVREWLDWADCLVMHNADFDLRYIERELRKAERTPLNKPAFCTLESARVRWRGQPCGLAICLDRLGLGDQGQIHDAFRDAYLTARLYFHFHGVKVAAWSEEWPMPTNLLPSPPPPMHPFPRRSPKKPGWRSAPESAPAAEVPKANRSFKSAIQRARDGHLLIRFVGMRANMPPEMQAVALDAYSTHVAKVLGRPLDPALCEALRVAAFEMIGSQNGATTASKRLADDREEMAVVLPILMEMVKGDGELSAAEGSAIRHIFSVIKSVH